jgi:hypothetical protein
MEPIKPYPVIVPYDFTPISDIAIDHAAEIAKLCNYPITILNIVDKSTQFFIKENNIIGNLLNSKLQSICEEGSKKFNIPFNYLLQKSRVISIRKIAAELHASFLVIGIDKPKTDASTILRMIGTSPAPVYVIQDKIEWKPIKSIIFPIDGFVETRQKISCAINLARSTGANLKLFSIKKAGWGRQKTQEVVIAQIEKELIEHKIDFTLEFAKGQEEYFADELLEYGKANGELFILMKTPRTFFANTFFDKSDKKVLLNTHNIPTVYVNSREVGIPTANF